MNNDLRRFYRLQEPLKLFIEQYESFVVTAKIRKPNTEEGPRVSNPGAIPRQIARRTGNTLLLRTKFGLRLYVEDLEPLPKQETSPDEPKPEPFQTKSDNPTSNWTSSSRRQSMIRPHTNFHYLIFPDFVSPSYLWYDPKWGKKRVVDLVVKPDEIERRYSHLAPYFEAWRKSYDESYEERRCYLNDLTAFPDLETASAWHVAGFLMAYWLVQQENVSEVKYNPDERSYRLDKKNLRIVLQKFLRDQYRMVAWNE